MREIAVYRRAINLAIKKWGIALPGNVFAGAKITETATNGDDENSIDDDEGEFYEGRNRIPTQQEIDDLTRELSKCRNPLVLPAFQLALETGLRKAELLGLKWSDVNFETRELHVKRVADLNNKTKSGTKNGQTGKIPLTFKAIDVLKALFRPTVRIFAGLTYDGIDMSFERAKTRAGVINLRWHDLRHAAITKAAIAFRGDIFKLKKFSRHETFSMLARYINYDSADLLDNLDSAA